MYILHIVDVWFKQNYTIVIGQHWTNGLTLQVRYFWITIRFPNEKIYRWKLMWADFDIELPWLYSNYFDNLNDKLKHLVFFYLVTFCSCLLTSMRIFASKKKFLTWSKYFSQTNLKRRIFQFSIDYICLMLEYFDHLRQD